MKYEGSCHCGAVSFEVFQELPTEAVSCNCSHCRRKGFLLTFVPASSVTLTSGHDFLRTYTFNKHKLRHFFCRTCGVQPLSEGAAPDGTETRAVNLRCVPALELEKLRLIHYDGAALQ